MNYFGNGYLKRKLQKRKYITMREMMKKLDVGWQNNFELLICGCAGIDTGQRHLQVESRRFAGLWRDTVALPLTIPQTGWEENERGTLAFVFPRVQFAMMP